MLRFGNYLQPNWDWRAAGNFMFGGTGSALIFMAAISSYPATPVMPVGLAALAFVGLGLFLVWLEIGRPWRAINVFFHPETSWMTREAIVAVVLFGMAFFGVVLQWPVVVLLAGLTGLVFLYCQAQILKASRGIPSWREPAIVPLIIGTGLSEGTAILLLLTLVFGAAPVWVTYLLVAFVAFRLYAWNNYYQKLVEANAPEKTLQILSKINMTQVLAGNVIPLLLIVTALFIGGNMGAVAMAAAALLIALTGWQMKFTIVARASQVQGYAIGKLQRGRPNLKPPVCRTNKKLGKIDRGQTKQILSTSAPDMKVDRGK